MTPRRRRTHPRRPRQRTSEKLLHTDHQQSALRRIDRDLRVRLAHRRLAGPHDPPRQHPGDEWRQLSPGSKPLPPGHPRRLISPQNWAARAWDRLAGYALQALPCARSKWNGFAPPPWPTFLPPLTDVLPLIQCGYQRSGADRFCPSLIRIDSLCRSGPASQLCA